MLRSGSVGHSTHSRDLESMKSRRNSETRFYRPVKLIARLGFLQPGSHEEVPMPVSTWITLILAFCFVTPGEDLTPPEEPPAPVKVFVLAGQSNMEGKGAVSTLPWLGEDPEQGHLLATIRDGDGEWIERDDVSIWYLGRHGPLTVGFGSEGSSHGPLIGPELGFGTVMGTHFDEPVLLIKTAWGGKDVAVDFLPPERGGPGPYWAEMISHVKTVLSQRDELFPELAGRPSELAGLVWFQGWNDMVDEEKTAAYADNFSGFIRDFRKEFERPDLPVVIGELGVGGDAPSPNVQRFRDAQARVLETPGFEGTVKLVRTSTCWDPVAHELFENDVWKGDEKERFYRIASDRPYHYLGSGKIYFLMGHAFGEGMIELLKRDESDAAPGG